MRKYIVYRNICKFNLNDWLSHCQAIQYQQVKQKLSSGAFNFLATSPLLAEYLQQAVVPGYSSNKYTDCYYVK